MEDLRCHSIHTFFKILDADLYGGKGSIGYAASNVNEACNVPTIEAELEYTANLKKQFAKIAEVPVENVIQISRDEYHENTDEDKDEDLDIHDYDTEEYWEEEE